MRRISTNALSKIGKAAKNLCKSASETFAKVSGRIVRAAEGFGKGHTVAVRREMERRYSGEERSEHESNSVRGHSFVADGVWGASASTGSRDSAEGSVKDQLVEDNPVERSVADEQGADGRHAKQGLYLLIGRRSQTNDGSVDDSSDVSGQPQSDPQTQNAIHFLASIIRDPRWITPPLDQVRDTLSLVNAIANVSPAEINDEAKIAANVAARIKALGRQHYLDNAASGEVDAAAKAEVHANELLARVNAAGDGGLIERLKGIEKEFRKDDDPSNGPRWL